MLQTAPAAPRSLEELEIPVEYQFYEYGIGQRDTFLLGDSGPSPNRILIFGRRENLKILKKANHWFADGTFKSAPQLFYQVYVVLAGRFGGVHPIVYILLPNKQQRTYQTMLQMLKGIQADFNSAYISCDFELADINAFKEEFKNVTILGCFFHLTKNVKLQLAHLQLTRQYNTDADFALQFRMITSLAFVPVPDLDAAIEELENALPENLRLLLQWFEDHYIGRANRRGNVYDRVLLNRDRTNNYAEAAHRRLQTELGMDHPILWKFISELKKIQRGRDLAIEQLISGTQPEKKLNKYLRADRNIRNIVEDYQNRNITDYLRGISHNYEMNA